MLRLAAALLSSCLLWALPAAAQRYSVPLVAPPAGYAWQPLPASKAAMLLPDGWHYRAEGEKASPTYHSTPEAAGESGEYQTGLSLQTVRKTKARTGRPSPKYADGPGRALASWLAGR